MRIKQTAMFRRWLDGLRDMAGRARIQARIARLADGNPGDHRNLEGGFSELRIDIGPGYRVYYTKRGACLILLLIGGDKSSQSSDIRRAGEMVQQLKDFRE